MATYDLFEEVRINFPSIAAEAERWEEINPGELAIFMSDGEEMRYDSFRKTMRSLNCEYKSDKHKYEIGFGYNFTRTMRRYGFDQYMLAEATGLPQATISRYTTGRMLPSVYNIKLIADAVGCSVSELVEFK